MTNNSTELRMIELIDRLLDGCGADETYLAEQRLRCLSILKGE